MLKLKYLFENYDLAKKCLSFYDYDKGSVDEMLQYFRISSNAVYPFRSGINPERICFLRLSPAEEKPFSEVVSEGRLINWLVENGFSAMKPVAMRNGNFAEQTATAYGCYNISCFEAVPGESLEDTAGTLQIVKEYGQILGQLHNLMKRYPYAEERRDHKGLLEEIRERLRQYHASELVLTEFASVSEELDKLPILFDNYGVVHYDFEPDNVFYDAERKKFNVIDFDDVIRCWYALDVVRAIDALGDVVDDEDPDVAEHWFLEGYKSASVFSEEQMLSLSLMRRLVHLQEYATLLHVMSEPILDKPEWMDKLTDKLKYKLKSLEESMAH